MTAPIVIKEEVVEPEVFERIVKEEPLEDEAQHIENTGDSPTEENSEAQKMQGVKRRNVEYVEYAPHGYMPYHVYPPPSKMVRSEGRPMHPHAPYPIPHRMAQHPQFVYGPAPAMGQRKGPKPRHMAPMMVNSRGEMIYPTPAGLMPQSMRSPQVVPQQQMDPGARYVTVDPATGKQEVYMMVKMNEASPRQSPGYSTPPYSVNPRPPTLITTPEYSSPQMRMVPRSVPAHAIVHQPGIKRAARAPKTAFTFPSLITLALLNAPGRKAVVTTIYDFLTEHFHGFNSVRANWRNSVRHALSYASFTKAETSPDSTVERGIEWCFAEGRLEKLMEDVQRAVSQNEHTPEKLFLRNIENLPKILRGEMGVSRVSIIRVVGGQQEHILTPRHNGSNVRYQEIYQNQQYMQPGNESDPIVLEEDVKPRDSLIPCYGSEE